jgi:hypothetical protein
MGLALTIATFWNIFRPRPPLHEQFARNDHFHTDYISRDVIRDLKDELAGRWQTLSASIEKHCETADDRARRLHQRIDPLASMIAATNASLENHLSDHRATAAKGGKPS